MTETTQHEETAQHDETGAGAAPQPAAAEHSFTVTANAAKRINTLVEAEGDAELMLRVAVQGGGCSGFRYTFDFERNVNADDILFERDGARVVIDDVSLELLDGSQLEFVEALIGSYFEVQNPNASSSCGCGASFAI